MQSLNSSRPTSPLAQHRRDRLEELRALIEQKKAQAALEELEDQERQRRDQKEAARQAEENEARQERRAREAEQARRDRELEERERQQKESERRQFWIDEQVEFALRSVPPEIAGRFPSEIQLSVEEALQGLGPSRPKTIVERVVHSAVQQVVQPFLQEQRRKQEIAIAANDSLYVPGLLGYGERKIRAGERVLTAILQLPDSATIDQMRVVGRAAAQQVVQEYEQQEEQERAHRKEQQDREKREREIDGYLGDVLPYLMELERTTGARGVDFEGETFQYAPRIQADIKPTLLQDPSLNCFTAKQRVRQLVDEWIENSLDERDAE